MGHSLSKAPGNGSQASGRKLPLLSTRVPSTDFTSISNIDLGKEVWCPVVKEKTPKSEPECPLTYPESLMTGLVKFHLQIQL